MEINRLRGELAMPLVDDQLKEVGQSDQASADTGGSDDSSANTPSSEASSQTVGSSIEEPQPDHSAARAIYAAYLEKVERLKPHWAYAKRVAKATTGRGQTPVRPLATMGNDGGPLLCDHCGKAILLEGGLFHNVRADAAWRRNEGDPNRDKWTSWILGGLVVQIQTNGTLRIYHGYLGMDKKHCCNIAATEIARQRKRFDNSERSRVWPQVLEFLKDEFPEMELDDRTDLLNKILDLVFEYDPGIGINRPS